MLKKNVYNFIHSTYTIFQRIYTILYIQYTKIFNSVHSVYTIFKKCTKLCTFNIHKFSILYIKYIQFLKFFYPICTFGLFNVCKIFKECTKLCIFNVSKNSKMYKILCIHCTFFFSNNVYKFINIDNFKKVYIIFFNCTHFFKDCTKFFQRIYKIMYIQLAQFVKKYKK